MKNSKKTKIITSTSLATILSATAVGIASCSNIALARVKFSEVTSDVDEINIIPGVGFKQSVKLNAIFKDSNGNVVDDIEPKWVSNIDGINYYGDLPEGVLKIENNALVVDPCAITNQLFEGTCDVVIWAQTQNDKLEKDKMVSKTIKVTSTPTLDVPRYAQITNNNSMITVACGAEQQPYSCNLGITYWSGVINQEAFDDTNWTVLNRDGLPEDVILTVEQDKTNINNGILTVDPRKCSQSYDGFYNVVIQAQSKKCPTVLTKTTVQISLLGDSTPVSAKIIGDSELTIDPKTPHDYKFAYQCDIKNAGGSTIDNSPKSWYFDAAQLQALNNAGITLKFDNDNLVINTLACTLTEAKTFPLNVTCASEFESTVNDTITININVNKFDATPANVNLNDVTDLVACATGDNITQDYSNLILVNKSDATLDASTGTLDLKLSSVQSKEYINSNIECSVDNKVLTVNTKNINPDFVNKRSDLQVNLIASYTTTENIEIKTEHAINLHINPQNDIVAYSTITLEGGSSISVSTANTEPTHTGVRFDSKLWNSTNALLAGKKPIFEYSVPEGESLPENLEISFDENNEMIVDATNVGHIGKQTFNLTVTCKKYLDNGQEKVITEESKAEQVQIGFTITDNANYIVTTDDQTIDLTPLIDPNEFCTVLSAGVHYVYVTPKDGGEKVGIKATNIKQVSITNCNTSTEKRMINTNFLYSCSNLTSIDLTGLSNVKTIGNNFLYGCNALQTIDLSPLICVTQIGSSFLANCNKLISNDENKLDLTGLKNVASIADSFMAGCSKVDYLDFRPLTKIKTESAISGSFLSGCDNLTRVNMGTISSRCLQKSSQSFATSVAGVPMYLTGITLISTADTEGYRDKFPDSTISPYRKLNIELSANRIIYDGIGYDLSDDLDPSKAFCGDLLFEIPLKDQTDPLGSLVVTELTKFKITSITITKVKSGIVSIDDNFLKDCSGLETIDLSGLKDIVSVGQNFLSGCSKLNEIDLSPMTSLAHVGTGFANKCANLTELNIGSLKATYFDNSEYTLAHSSVYDRGYGAGTLVVGEDKDKFVSIFKELKSSSSYRYLITDSTMNFINLSDGTRIQLAQEFNINTLCGTSNSNSSYQVSVPLKVDGKSVVRSIRLGEIYDLSVRDPAIIYGISNCFMKHAELLRNIYISELNTIGSIGREFCAYCYNLRSMNFEMFPNIKTIDGNYFMHKNSSLRNMDFSVLNDRGKNLQFTGNSGPLVDCYNLMMINFGAIQLGNLALSANAAFGIRNQFEAPAYILGRAFVGDNASDLINKFKPRLWIEETKGEDSVKITDHFMCFHINVNARLWLWNSREYNPLIDDIIDELIEKLPV